MKFMLTKPKPKYCIGIDMDDTIENLLDAWTDWLNAKYGLDYHDADITDWDLQKTYTMLTREQIFEPLYSDAFWMTVKPKKDAIEYIGKLIEDGFQVFICTNTHYSTLCTKMTEVLFKYFPYISWDNVIVCKYKSLCKFDVLVDDYEENLIYGDYLRILYDTPHNQHVDDDKYKIHRVKNWQQVYGLIHLHYDMKYGD